MSPSRAGGAPLAAAGSDRSFDHEQLVALLVDSVVDYAIFVLWPDGTVRTWNPGAARLKGYERDEIVGEHFSTFYTPEDREDGLPATLLAETRREGRVQHRGWRVRADGSRFWGDVTITALRDDGGELVGFAKVTRDLTERHEIETARQRALEREREAAVKLADLDERRRRLLAGISHDLAAPIAVVRGTVELLIDEPDMDPEERTEMLRLISRNADQLDRLTGQLRELSRLERGQVDLDPRRISLETAVDECVGNLRPLLDGLTVEIEATGDVEADPLAFERVLTNLLTNAARYSPEGGRIRVVSDDRPDVLAIGVTDEGPGVEQGDAGQIFDEFQRGSAEPDGAGPAGLGLGLSIVRHYVEQHGGRVWVESEPGEGAAFWFTLPAARGRSTARTR